MSKSMKRLLIAVALVAVIVLAIRLFVNADQFRPLLETRASELLGRKVTIGKLSLAVVKGAVQADELIIADDAAFSQQPFVTAKGLKVGVQMMPLLTGKDLIVDSVEIIEPQVHLVQGADMRWNYSTLGATGKPGQWAAQAADASGGASREFTVKRLTLAGGTLTIQRAGGGQPITVEKLDAEATGLSATSAMPIDVKGVIKPGAAFQLRGSAGPVKKGDAALTPIQADFSIEALPLVPSGVVPARAGFGGVMTLAAKLVSQDGASTLNAKAKVAQMQVGPKAKPAGKPVDLAFTLVENLKTHAGTVRDGVLQSGSAKTNFNGTYEARPGALGLSLNVNGDSLPIDEIVALLPAFGIVLPNGSAPKGGTLSLNSRSQGTADNLTTNGRVTVSNTTLAGYSLGSSVASAAAIAGLKVGENTVIQSLQSDFQNTPAATTLTGLQMVVQDLGRMAGGLTVGSGGGLSGQLTANIHTSGGLTGMALKQAGGSGEMNLTVPITVSGTTDNPRFSADTKAVASQAAQSAAASAIGKVLGDKSGGLGSLGGLFGKKKK